jgi:MFS family permease
LDQKNSPYSSSAFQPFRSKLFLMLWTATLISNIGTWINSVGASWLLASLDVSPLIISLTQTATTLPFFLLVLPAGALADILDRRKVVLIVNIFMMSIAILFAYIVWAHKESAYLVLGLTFMLGTGAAIMAPAWQALIPSTVSKADLPQAVALGSININLSRAIGPALAGLLVSYYGLASPFIANAISFVAVIIVMVFWNQQQSSITSKLPPEKIWWAIRAGIRYAGNSKHLKATMLHIFGFMFFANAFWGLVPLISKNQLHGNAAFFGYLMGTIGIGGVMAGLTLPTLKVRFKVNSLVATGTAITALITGFYAINSSQWQALLAGILFGFGWVLVLSSLNVSAQQSLPDWVRARGLAVYLMVFFGGISAGSAFWGWFATQFSIAIALQTAGLGAVLFAFISLRTHLQQGATLDLAPSMHWPIPIEAEPIAYHRGPVIITVRYQVNSEDEAAFLRAIYRLKTVRMQYGVYRWGIFEDVEKPGQYLEIFWEDSWAEHMRHHDRFSKQYKLIQDEVQSYHKGNTSPQTTHFISADL